MRKIICGVLAAIFLMLAAFCVFGFLATLEPVDNALIFRGGYTLIGLGCLSGAAFLIRIGFRKSK